jgi:uncharacterized protein
VKVFLDTNVLVSAFVSRGLCADLLRAVLSTHELIVGDVVLLELREALAGRVGVPLPMIDEIEGFLRGYPVVPRPANHLALALRDPDDEWIVASAVAGEAEVLITGDADLLDAVACLPLPVMTPRQSWRLLRGDLNC